MKAFPDLICANRNEDIRKMRLRWWRDGTANYSFHNFYILFADCVRMFSAIDGIYRGAVLEYPVTLALRDAVQRCSLHA